VGNNTITLQVGGALELVLRQPEPQGEVYVTVQYEQFTVKAKGDHMAYTLPIDKYISVQVAYVDAHGNPAVVDGDVTWASSDDSTVTVAVDPTDSTKCKVTPVGPAGTAQVTATADADLGEGTRELITLLDLVLVAGEAVAGTISIVGDPQPMSA